MITSSIQDILMMYVWEDDLDLTSREEIVNHAQKKLFNFDYPLYDNKLKYEFEKNFIRHFYTREIGSESVALFKLRLEDYLHLNHEKWQRLYQNVDETINPFTKLFQYNNSEIIVSRYRSINGYTLFYIYDFEHNLLSEIMQSNSAPIKTYDARIITKTKNFKRVKELHDWNIRYNKPTLINEIELLEIKRYKQEVK